MACQVTIMATKAATIMALIAASTVVFNRNSTSEPNGKALYLYMMRGCPSCC